VPSGFFVHKKDNNLRKALIPLAGGWFVSVLPDNLAEAWQKCNLIEVAFPIQPC